MKMLRPHIKVVLIHSHSKLLSAEPLPDEVKDCALNLIIDAGVDVLLDCRMERSTERIGDDGVKCLELNFANGRTMIASHLIMAVSRSVPSTEFLPPAVLGADGYVKIRPRCVDSPLSRAWLWLTLA